MTLQETFQNLVEKYCSDQKLIEELWTEIKKKYSSSKRHYHNLAHIENLLSLLQQHKNAINDWDTVLFAIFYHDIVYKVLKNDNEEKSALLAQKRITQINYPENKIQLCVLHILATKSHEISLNKDTNLFTDADLAILGFDWKDYKDYYQKIRKEYAIYPDFLYNSGRKKVLSHFLSMPQIYKTKLFLDLYEQKARENVERELKIIS
jgi:predicted metal-dependent HD superfamily phosphohydrolase